MHRRRSSDPWDTANAGNSGKRAMTLKTAGGSPATMHEAAEKGQTRATHLSMGNQVVLEALHVACERGPTSQGEL